MMGIESTVGSIMSIQTKLVGNNQFIRFGNSIFCVFQRTSWVNEGDVSKLECPAEKKTSNQQFGPENSSFKDILK